MTQLTTIVCLLCKRFKKNGYLGIYFGSLVGKNIGPANNERETYRFKDVTCEHEDAFMGLHFINDPLCEMYDLPYSNKLEETYYLRKVTNKANLHQMKNFRMIV